MNHGNSEPRMASDRMAPCSQLKYRTFGIPKLRVGPGLKKLDAELREEVRGDYQGMESESGRWSVAGVTGERKRAGRCVPKSSQDQNITSPTRCHFQTFGIPKVRWGRGNLGTGRNWLKSE